MKTGFLITARLKSSRLPLKVLKSLAGRRVVEHVITRARQVKGIAEIILCTSTNPQDKPLVDIARDYGIYYFTGSEDDVLQRLGDAATFFGLDNFLSITADNPLFSIDHGNIIADILKREKRDYVKVSGLPLGTALCGVNTRAVQTLCVFKGRRDTEIWGPFIDRGDLFDVQEVQVRGILNRPEFRLTLDYEEDYRLLYHLYENLGQEEYLNLYEAVEYLALHPEIAALNRSCTQRKIDPEILHDIDRCFATQKQRFLEIKQTIYEGKREHYKTPGV